MTGMTAKEWADLQALRTLLAHRFDDEYAYQFKRQQDGKRCEHCWSNWGHYGECPLLNGGVGAAYL